MPVSVTLWTVVPLTVLFAVLLFPLFVCLYSVFAMFVFLLICRLIFFDLVLLNLFVCLLSLPCSIAYFVLLIFDFYCNTFDLLNCFCSLI